MSDDIFDRTDLDGADYQARRGAALGATGESGKCIAWVNTPFGAFLDQQRAAELATFLLAAIGPDAAREALAKLDPWPFAGETPLETTARLMRERNAAEARAERAEKRLAAALALVADWRGLLTSHTDGESFKEGVAYCAKKLEKELRAAEGAEAATGATT